MSELIYKFLICLTNIQEDYEIWERKLPNDYEQIFKMSKFSEIYSTEKKKDLHNLLSKGIILQKGTEV